MGRHTDAELAAVRGSKVINYQRESMVAKEHKISRDLQDRAMGENTHELNLAVVDTIFDSDKTGRNFERDIQLAIQAIMRGEADHIQVYNLSRFGRNLRECLNYTGDLADAGHLIISCDRREGIIDVRTSDGRRKAADAYSYAEDQSDRIGDGWRRVIERQEGLGITHSNTERWGYRWCAICKRTEQCSECKEKKREGFCKKCPQRPRCDACRDKPQIPDPQTAPVLVATYEQWLSGTKMGAIVRDLNKRGFRAMEGGKWSTTKLYGVLDTGFAAGLIRKLGPVPSDAGNISGRKRLMYSIYLQGAQEPILSIEKWEEYKQRRIEGTKETAEQGKAKFAETGLVFCAECGSRMNGVGDRSRWRCSGYQMKDCVHSANMTILSDLVREFLKEHADNPAILQQINISLRAHLKAINARPVEDLEAFERAEVSLTRERRALVSNLNKGLIEPDDYNAEKDRLDAEIGDAKRQIALMTPRDVPTFPPPEFFTDLIGKWKDIAADDQRNILRRLIWRIEVKKGERSDRTRYRIIPLWEAYLYGFNGTHPQR